MQCRAGHKCGVPRRLILLTSVLAVVFLFLMGCRSDSVPRAPTNDTEPAESRSSDVPSNGATVADSASGGSRTEVGGAQAPSAQPGEIAAVPAEPSGQQLYTLHCSACHGERGDGKGIAAAYLFPKPRDFRAGRFRLVSTQNNVPTREDLRAVLLRGMPGSAMPPWGHLTEQQRDALVDEVLRFRREGARELVVTGLKEDDELTDEEIAAEDVQQEIRDLLDRTLKPGASVAVPEIGPSTAESISRGKAVYAKYGCIQCHGEGGKGDGVQKMVDDEQLPTSPRDFTLGIFKGGDDPASLYRRTAYGMPGTPMPSSRTMTPEQMIDLVHYIRSLSTEEQRRRVVLNREKILVQSVDRLPAAADSDIWSSVEPVRLAMTPLWWRNDADPEFQVQAVHDGRSIAVRLTWRDETNDIDAARSQSFDDAVAMELYRGDAEPFLGMGDPKSPIDVWFWDAGRQGKPLAVEKLYPNTVVDVYPFSEVSVTSAELNRDGARTADQPDISLPARASGNLIVPAEHESGASTLTAGGPGSVTFRIPRSQIVFARGQWNDDHWSVLMTRKLAVEADDDGIALEPGGRASVAFAVWNGSRQDRDGKKRITIWQDLELEP